MKKYLFFCWVLLQIAHINAQITVTNATFPSLGDTLRYRMDDSPSGLDLGTVGGNQTWDFTQLDAGGDVMETIFQSATSGTGAAYFPNATLLTATQVRETYYRKTPTVLKRLATQATTSWI